jgi:hypothetical protein
MLAVSSSNATLVGDAGRDECREPPSIAYAGDEKMPLPDVLKPGPFERLPMLDWILSVCVPM